MFPMPHYSIYGDLIVFKTLSFGWFILGVIVAVGGQNRFHLVKLDLPSPQKRRAAVHSDSYLELTGLLPAKLLTTFLAFVFTQTLHFVIPDDLSASF